MRFDLRYNPGDTLYLVHDDKRIVEQVTVDRITLKYVDFLSNGEKVNYEWRNDNPYIRYRITYNAPENNGKKTYIYFKDSGTNVLEVRSLFKKYHFFTDTAIAEKYLKQLIYKTR